MFGNPISYSRNKSGVKFWHIKNNNFSSSRGREKSGNYMTKTSTRRTFYIRF